MERELRAMLYQFTNGTTPCKAHLIRHFSKDVLDWALQLHYIKEYGCNTSGETIYTITELGREFRDG